MEQQIKDETQRKFQAELAAKEREMKRAEESARRKADAKGSDSSSSHDKKEEVVLEEPEDPNLIKINKYFEPSKKQTTSNKTQFSNVVEQE